MVGYAWKKFALAPGADCCSPGMFQAIYCQLVSTEAMVVEAHCLHPNPDLLNAQPI